MFVFAAAAKDQEQTQFRTPKNTEEKKLRGGTKQTSLNIHFLGSFSWILAPRHRNPENLIQILIAFGINVFMDLNARWKVKRKHVGSNLIKISMVFGMAIIQLFGLKGINYGIVLICLKDLG